ncbi:MAG: sulfite exporter TauE/SafE family protein [Asgard group archaeon]|nr:sulfite exporter TauE/SafE family protein [Asgard group archaeon]
MLTLPWYIVFSLIIIAILICTIGAIAGFAGGVLMLPIFALILVNYGFDLVVIIGSNAAGTIFTGLISTIMNINKKEINWLLGFVFVIPIFAGNFLGAYITTLINENSIATVFSIIIIFLAILMIIKWYNQKMKQNSIIDTTLELNNSNNKTTSFFEKINSFLPTLKIRIKDEIYLINFVILTFLGFTIGTVSGIVGLGCGWAVPPILILLYNIPPQIAISTALFMTTLSLTANGIIHIVYSHFNIWIWLIVAIGSIIGGFIGVFLKRKFKARNLILFISIIMVIISILMLIKTWTDYF